MLFCIHKWLLYEFEHERLQYQQVYIIIIY